MEEQGRRAEDQHRAVQAPVEITAAELRLRLLTADLPEEDDIVTSYRQRLQSSLVQALAIRGDKIIATGASADITKQAGAKTRGGSRQTWRSSSPSFRLPVR